MITYMLSWEVGLDDSLFTSLDDVVNKLGVAVMGSNKGSREETSSSLSDCVGMV